MLLLSLLGLFLFPALLGPEAHGWLQYFLALELFLLAFPNGCAAPVAAHYIALYRVSDPGRQGVLLKQVFRWFLLLLLAISVFYLVLPDRRGFGWIHLAVGFSGCSQLLASALYGSGLLGAVTWFPVLNMAVRLALVAGYGGWVAGGGEVSGVETWETVTLPLLLLVSTLPSWIWMVRSFFKNSSRWFPPDPPKQTPAPPLFPWEEIRRFGLAALFGQVLFQSFTRSLTVVAAQIGHPRPEVGYLGLSIQIFGQILFIAGFVSVALYPWLVSAGEAGDRERFRRLQSVAWRLCVFLGGWLTAGILALIRPAVWVILPDYRPDIDLFVDLVRIGALSGAIVLAGEFHLRMLVSLTRMKPYLIALSAGFLATLVYLVGVLYLEGGIRVFSLGLLVGGLAMTVVSLSVAPKTEGFWKHSLLAIAGVALSILVSSFFSGDNLPSILVQGAILSLVYFAWSWGVGLAGIEDFERLRTGSRAAS